MIFTKHFAIKECQNHLGHSGDFNKLIKMYSVTWNYGEDDVGDNKNVDMVMIIIKMTMKVT